MFSKSTNASKIALLHLIERLKFGNFSILDTQFITEHLKTFGAYEIDQESFLIILKKALLIDANFFSIGPPGELNIKIYPKSNNY
jgi:leucyl/phenylalanyl-tRNA--protein transferase